MRKLFAVLGLAALLGACSAERLVAPSDTTQPTPKLVVTDDACAPRGSEGYDFTSMMYRGRADGADFVWDCSYLGNATLGRAHLLINWNAEYVRAVMEGGSNPPYVNAYYSNQWSAKGPDGADQIVFIKAVWTPWCASIHIDDPRRCQGMFEIEIWKVLAGHELFMIVSPYPAGKRMPRTP